MNNLLNPLFPSLPLKIFKLLLIMAQVKKISKKKYKEIVKGYSEKMRNNPTLAESQFQDLLIEYCVDYEPQKVIYTSKGKWYIADFLIGKNIIEIDGNVHNRKEVKKKDEERTTNLNKDGFSITRITNDEIKSYLKIRNILENLQKIDYFPNFN